ncbi:MAG TPA: hypothetical protein VNF68_06795, partial [Candidatus Baltobacteraceae bacterium]|nr:hypothetical protein [Candidatus Baltobacteraceae bacterium]
MKMIRLVAAGLSAALLLGAAPKAEWVPPATADSITHSVVHVNGAAIPYTARAGTITLRNDKEQVTARIFYTAFTKD